MKSRPYKINWPKGLNHEDWGHLRKSVEGIGEKHVRIGASDVATITGSNKWKCAQRLFYHLTGYYNSFFVTERTLAGHLMEEITISRWESWVADEQESLNNSLHKIKVRKAKKANFFILNDAYPHGFASLDYVPSGKQFSPFTGELYKPLTPIECKHTNWAYKKLWPESGITQQHKEQVNWQMLLTNTEVAIFLVLVDGVSFSVKEEYADKALQQKLLEDVNKFAELVTLGKEALAGMAEAKAAVDMEIYTAYNQIFESVTPEPVGSFSSEGCDNLDLMQELYSEPIDDEVSIKVGDATDERWMDYYLKCNKTIANITEKKNLARVHLLQSCGNYEGIKTDNRKMTNRRATQDKKAYFNIK